MDEPTQELWEESRNPYFSGILSAMKERHEEDLILL